MKSVSESDSNTTMFYHSHSRMIVRREKICDNCKYLEEDFEENFTLEDFIDSLSEEEQRDALVHLSLKWVEKQNVSLPFASAKKK